MANLASGCALARRFSRGSNQATEAIPVLVEVTPQLADPSLGEAELRAHVRGALAGHEIFSKAAISFGTRAEPGREIEAEGDLLGRWRLRVVVQRLHKRPAT